MAGEFGGADFGSYAKGASELASFTQTLRSLFTPRSRTAERQAAQATYASMLALRQLAAQGRVAGAYQAAQARAAGLVPITFGPASYERKLQRARYRVTLAGPRIAAAQRVTHPRVGDRSGAKLRRAEKKLEKLQAKAQTLGEVVLSAAYGLNNPILAGSRDDPRGVTRPNVIAWRY